jgi:hypothetical protein
MYAKTSDGVGQAARKTNAEDNLLRQALASGLRFQAEIEGRMRNIQLPPSVLRSPYLPEMHRESGVYQALSRDERAKVAATVSRIFKQGTGIIRNLNPRSAKDITWVRVWLALRDIVIRAKAEGPFPATRVWSTEPLPSSEFHRFDKAIKDLETKVSTTTDPRRWRYQCWIGKLKKPDTDDRIITWGRICPKTSGAIGAAWVVGPCDLTQGTPVDQATLQRSIRTVGDVEAANKALQFITYMRSDIVVSFEMTSLPLENLRSTTDDAGLAVEKLDKWANSQLGGSSAMPPAYRAIKDWIMKRQNDPKSLYSCF